MRSPWRRKQSTLLSLIVYFFWCMFGDFSCLAQAFNASRRLKTMKMQDLWRRTWCRIETRSTWRSSPFYQRVYWERRVSVIHVLSEYQHADFLTKSLEKFSFAFHRDSVMNVSWFEIGFVSSMIWIWFWLNFCMMYVLAKFPLSVCSSLAIYRAGGLLVIYPVSQQVSET